MRIMNKDELWHCLNLLNDKLAIMGVYGEIGIYGGAVMCLVLNARDATEDIDAILNPKYDINKAVKLVAEELGISDNWLNDGVKGFVSENNDLILFNAMSNLNIYAASPKYMFAMKSLACRTDNKNDIEDIKFLLEYLGITSVSQAEEVIYQYYPQKRLLPKTFYVLMEILGG